MVVAGTIAVTENILLKNELSNTGYTVEWVLNMLYEHNPKFLAALSSNKIKDLSAKDISEGKGFLSRIFRVIIEFTDATSYAFIMKVPTMDCLEDAFKAMDIDKEAMNKFMSELLSTHSKEVDAYALIEDVKNFPKAEVYYTEYQSDKHPGVIVMEYLDKATTIGMFRSVTVQQILNVARHFGTLQITQMNEKDELWRGKYAQSMHTYDTSSEDDTAKFMKKMCELRPEFEKPIQQLLDFDYVELAKYSLKQLPAEYNCMTLCQGDAWSNNIMFCTGADGSVLDKVAAIIDWQILFESAPVFDLARFIAIGADAEIRRECERKAVDVLYNTFCEESAKLGRKVNYTLEQAHELYDYSFIHQTYGMVGMASFSLISNLEKAPENVYRAQYEKTLLRARFCIEDALELIQKYNIFERFPLKK